MARDETKISQLRELPGDQARAETCLGWAEEERHQYYLGQQEAMRRHVARFVGRTGHEPAPAERAVLKVQANTDWGASTAAKDCRVLETMYGRWADTYFHAAQLAALHELIRGSRPARVPAQRMSTTEQRV